MTKIYIIGLLEEGLNNFSFTCISLYGHPFVIYLNRRMDQVIEIHVSGKISGFSTLEAAKSFEESMIGGYGYSYTILEFIVEDIEYQEDRIILTDYVTLLPKFIDYDS